MAQGTSVDTLMQRAGRAVAAKVAAHCGSSDEVLVLCGPATTA
jgi:NAD(P)H-hydrate repair Nnr-like enzyme with NAD(P)H-hydrate epimerase domain